MVWQITLGRSVVVECSLEVLIEFAFACVDYALQKAMRSRSKQWRQAELLLPARVVSRAIRYGKTYRSATNASLPLANVWITSLCSFLRLIRPTVSIAELVTMSVLFGALCHVAYLNVHVRHSHKLEALPIFPNQLSRQSLCAVMMIKYPKFTCR